jgi:hypothetical protein
MKKILMIVLAVAVGMCLPIAAQAKADFELGGYIRMDAVWNSHNSLGHTLSGYVLRNNVGGANHGRFQMNANASRFNLTMKGPELWGGKVTGLIEVDFDGQDTRILNTASSGAANNGQSTWDSSFGQAKLRLRHAMFKIAWPDREWLFGQYWSVNSEMTPDTADSGGYCLYGATQLRIPQVRYTQKFMDGFDGSIAIEAPQNGRWGLNLDNLNPIEGEVSETPMVEAKIRYEQDLWGKAAWAGRPRGFYVGLGGGYFRTRNGAGLPAYAYTAPNSVFGITINPATFTWNTMGPSNYINQNSNFNVNNANYQDHWLFLIENFTPIIPTTTKSLAGTLGLAHQWWIGNGVSAWRLDLPGSDRYYQFNGNNAAGLASYDQKFIKRFGGWAQLQYYFTEAIYTNVNFGFEKAFGFSPGSDANLVNAAFNPKGFAYGNPNGMDPFKSAWRVSATQWYRPISAVKFGLQYSYTRTNYFQRTSVNSSSTNFGDAHTLFGTAYYLF